MTTVTSNYASEDHRIAANYLIQGYTNPGWVLQNIGIDFLESVADSLAADLAIAFRHVAEAVELVREQRTFAGGDYHDARRHLAEAHETAQSLAVVLDRCVHTRDEYRRRQQHGR